MIPREISIECSASEFGPGRFVSLCKEWDSIGKQGLIEIGLHEMGTELEIEKLGDLFKATVIEDSSCDPQNEK